MRPNSFREAPQSRVLVLLIVFLRDPWVDPRSLFAYRVMRGQKETSSSQVGRRKGFSWESPTTSSLVSSMSMEELRYFFHVLNDISLELSDGPTRSIVGQVDNVVYFYSGAVCSWTSLPCVVVGEAILAHHPSSSRACSFECFSDFNGL